MNRFGSVVSFDAIDGHLKAYDQWVLWECRQIGGRLTKIPMQATRPLANASTSDSKTWCSFRKAEVALCQLNRKLDDRTCEIGAPNLYGIGFVLTASDPFVGIDIDSAFDPKTKKPWNWAQRWIDGLNSYTEVSPSGDGLRAFVTGDLPVDGKRLGNHAEGGIEVYKSGRYLTVTGDVYHG